MIATAECPHANQYPLKCKCSRDCACREDICKPHALPQNVSCIERVIRDTREAQRSLAYLRHVDALAIRTELGALIERMEVLCSILKAGARGRRNPI